MLCMLSFTGVKITNVSLRKTPQTYFAVVIIVSNPLRHSPRKRVRHNLRISSARFLKKPPLVPTIAIYVAPGVHVGCLSPVSGLRVAADLDLDL